MYKKKDCHWANICQLCIFPFKRKKSNKRASTKRNEKKCSLKHFRRDYTTDVDPVYTSVYIHLIRQTHNSFHYMDISRGLFFSLSFMYTQAKGGVALIFWRVPQKTKHGEFLYKEMIGPRLRVFLYTHTCSLRICTEGGGGLITCKLFYICSVTYICFI